VKTTEVISMSTSRIGVFRVGEAIVDLHEDRDGYWGAVYARDHVWPFDGLKGPAIGVHDERELARAACSFGGYYGTFNRGDDLPDWAPRSPEIADAISDATCCAEEDGEVEELDDLPEWCAEMEVARG
jgi:hypothetical protein